MDKVGRHIRVQIINGLLSEVSCLRYAATRAACADKQHS